MTMTGRAALSFIGLQLGWFACVLGAGRGFSWFGPVVVSVGLLAHVWNQPRSARAREALVLFLAALLGFIVDTALLRAGIMTILGAAVSPPWLVALWPNLAAATASGGSLGSLSRRPILGALLGALAAPLAYDGGARLGAIGFEQGRLRALVTIGLVWSLVLPTLFWIRRWMDRSRGDRDASGLERRRTDPTRTPQRAE
jgi:hypothetical protein